MCHFLTVMPAELDEKQQVMTGVVLRVDQVTV
jgi:hypothetical protein